MEGSGEEIHQSVNTKRDFQFAVIGGGIAGVSCIEQILEFDSKAEILLVSASSVVKEISSVTRLTKTLQDFVIVEKPLKSFRDIHPSVVIVHDIVSEIRPDEHVLLTESNGSFSYKKLCISSGASPNILFDGNDHVLGIRDTHSVRELTKRLVNARQILLVGNGGIATELVYELRGVDIIWSIKDDSISTHFLDKGAAEFFIQTKIKPEHEVKADATDIADIKACKRMKYGETDLSAGDDDSFLKGRGSALGPDWHEGFYLQGANASKDITIQYETELQSVFSYPEYLKRLDIPPTSDEVQWPVYGLLSNGRIFGCDFIVSATGVRPNCEQFPVESDPQKGIYVNCKMKTNVKDIYAAGDVCFQKWEWSRHWFQMRLWTQARQMGLLAGKYMYTALNAETCMVREGSLSPTLSDNEPDFIFEVFSHVTRFFGFKVVLLGLYNAHGLTPGSYEYLVRCTKNLEYIKVVLQDSRMKGAILIGETGLEETFENLILNQLDLSPYGEDLLNPDVDIEDYFD